MLTKKKVAEDFMKCQDGQILSFMVEIDLFLRNAIKIAELYSVDVNYLVESLKIDDWP